MNYLNRPAWIGDVVDTPLGVIWIGMSPDGLAAVDFPTSLEGFTLRMQQLGFNPVSYDPGKVRPAIDQVGAYLRGERRSFDLPIDWSILTPFQEQVLRLTYAIPYGSTRTYAELAHQVGSAGAARAVGRAQATNPMPLVIPCHRVLGSDGKLHGYGAGEGLKTKEWLLRLEAANRT